MPRPPSHLLVTYTLELGAVTYQLLLREVLKADAPFPFSVIRSNPLHTLAHIWTGMVINSYLISANYAHSGDHLIVPMDEAPSPQLMDLISHLGSKQSIEVNLK